MSEPHTGTYAYLLAHYGPLLTRKHVAEVMHTTANGLRMAIARQQQPLAIGLASARRRLGRRVYFEAQLVAALIDADAEPAPVPKEPIMAPAGLPRAVGPEAAHRRRV